ncbi:allantoinase AllB, partial [Escherichia coli]
TRAALLGGLAAVFDMPNTKPPTVDEATLADKRERFTRDSVCDYGIYVGATKGNIPALAALEREGAVCG